jgi:hypothetical protein
MLLRFATIWETGRFVGFTVLGIALPGFALWRLIGNYRRNLVEDCAAGFAVGTAAQIIVYLASSSVGLQQWSWVWAPIVLLVTFLDRDVRTRVWSRVEEPLRPLQAWMLAVACAIVLIVVFVKGPMEFLPAYTDPLRSYPDLAFQQALAASAKYDVPIATLWLGGEPMKYHTFFHQSTAATAWATRIDLTDLIHSLAWLPLLLAGLALVFALTQRFMGRTPDGERRVGTTWVGPLAAGAVVGWNLGRCRCVPEPDAEPRRTDHAGHLSGGDRPAAGPAAQEPLGAAGRAHAGRCRGEVDSAATGRFRVRAGLLLPSDGSAQVRYCALGRCTLSDGVPRCAGADLRR